MGKKGSEKMTDKHAAQLASSELSSFEFPRLRDDPMNF